MYAVVSSGGKQYRVEPGTELTMERLGVAVGEPITFDRVLLIGDGDEVTVGTPVVSGASVSATVLGEELGPKLVIFKFKQKVKYRRRTGHRQHVVRVRIDAINADGKSTTAAAKVKPADAAPKAKRAGRARAAKPAAEAPKTATRTASRRPTTARAKPAATKESGAVDGAAGDDAGSAAKGTDADRAATNPARRRATRSKAEPKQAATTEGDSPQEQ